MTEQNDQFTGTPAHPEPVRINDAPATPTESRPWQPAPPTAVESFTVLGLLAVAAVCAWLLYSPMIRQLGLMLRHTWLGR